VIRNAPLRQLRATQGAVYIEYLIALLPVLLSALVIWQLLELWMGELMVRRAASVAVRAAAVVLPDDPAFYDGAPLHRFTGLRKTDIELSAALVLAASPQFVEKPKVTVIISASENYVTARVTAPFECFSGGLGLVCGGTRRQLTAAATYPYQGAQYEYSKQ